MELVMSEPDLKYFTGYAGTPARARACLRTLYYVTAPLRTHTLVQHRPQHRQGHLGLRQVDRERVRTLSARCRQNECESAPRLYF